MRSDLFILLFSMAIVFLLSFVWCVFYAGILNKKRFVCFRKKHDEKIMIQNNKFISLLRPAGMMGSFTATCSVLLPNTDDDIADALKYIKPSKNAGSLLEDLYEQTGI